MEAKDFAKLALLQDAANTDSTGQAVLHYEGGNGGSTGGESSGSGTGSTGTNADPNKAYENLGSQANDWPEKKKQTVW